jgi:cell division protein FtsW
MKALLRLEIILVIGLMLLGTFIVFSASGTYSEIRFHNYYFLFKNHVMKVLLAIAGMFMVSLIPVDIYKKYSKHLLFFIIIMLLATLIVNRKFNGASRWIDLGFLNFQPSEVAKIFLMIHIAKMIEAKGDLIKDFNKGFRYFLIWIVVISIIVISQPNISTAIIICLISFTMLYIGDAKLSHLFGVFSVGLVSVLILYFTYPHFKTRLVQYYNGLKGISELNIQVLQAKIGLGSGGVTGVGFGLSRQSDLFLPESYTDFIFSILGEELGFIGAVTIIVIYFAIFLVGIMISKRAKDRFSQLLGFGVSFNIIITALINIAVVTGLVPTTGVTLPFISYGGTSIIIFSASIGILVSIAQSGYVVPNKVEEKFE